MRRLRSSLVAGGTLGAAAVLAGVIFAGQGARAQSKAAAVEGSKEWPTYGHDAGGMRFSPLTEITPANVNKLKVAWVYHMAAGAAAAGAVGASGGAPAGGGLGGRGGGAGAGAAAGPDVQQVGEEADAAPAGRGGRGGGRGGGNGFQGIDVTPLVINGIMYISSTGSRVVALEPTTGKEVWSYKLPPGGSPSTRGVEYFGGDAKTPPQIVFGSRDGKLFSLDAKTGKPNPEFGDNGIVNMLTPDNMRGCPPPPAQPCINGLSSPPIVYKNLVITGGTTTESPATGAAGDVRAWDMETGKIKWTFRSIPAEGEKYNDTWAKDSWKGRTGVNVWGFITVDVQRGIVYMPFGAPSVDQYGGDREGNNLFSTSLVAADANTGKYLWHFQVVHHDIWDGDMTGAAALIDVKQGGKTIPAVAAINKLGLLFLLDRVTGKPIYGVEERPVPASEVPQERAAKTQPFPLKPPPLSRMTMSMADIVTITPELEAACRAKSEGVQMGGPYLPPAYNRLRVQFPGNHGGVNWFGTSFNPQLGYLFINTNEMGQLSGLQEKKPAATGASGGRGGSRGAGGQVGNRTLPGGPYESFPGGGRYSIPATDGSGQQLMCQQPPWGELTAVNVNTGEFAWRVPLGVTDSLPPGKQNTGRPGNGGTIATAGGLVFVGATDDARFRAFDAKTGKELWTYKLGGAAQATPITYQGRDGKQYVVITSTGGGFFNNPVTDDSIMAFALDNGK